MSLLDKWNKKRFSVFESDEKSVLELVEEINGFNKVIADEVDSKTENTGDHKGTWQGISRPTLSEEGMRGTVEKHITDISKLETHTKGKVNIYEYANLVVNNDWSNAINKAIQENEGKEIYLPNGEYLISSTILVNKTVKLTGESKLGTIIRTDTDIDMIYLQKRCEINNITLKVNLLSHSSTVITYFAIKGGNKFGKINDIYILGLDGYSNTTKAFRFKNLDGDSVSKAYFFFYTFENINVEFCDTFLLIDEDFTNCWTTSVSWKNVIVERCKAGVSFPGEFPWGYYSRYDFIDCQFQYNEKVTRVFNAPSDRSIIDWHIWDRSFFNTTAPLKSVMLKTGGRHNKIIIRNVDESQVETEVPRDYFVNSFIFFDSINSKNLFGDVEIYIDGVGGDDTNGNGSAGKPYKTINGVITLLPKLINHNVTIRLRAGTYSDNLNLSKFYGGGIIKFVGENKINTIIPSITLNKCNVNIELEQIQIAPAYAGDGINATNSNILTITDCNIISRSTNSLNGIILKGGQAKLNNCYFEKINNSIHSTEGATIYANGITGSGNAYACVVSDGGIIAPINITTTGFTIPYQKNNGLIIGQ